MGVLIFKFMSNPSLEYSIISYIVVALGLTASCFFLYQVKEVPLSQISHEKATILKK